MPRTKEALHCAVILEDGEELLNTYCAGMDGKAGKQGSNSEMVNLCETCIFQTCNM